MVFQTETVRTTVLSKVPAETGESGDGSGGRIQSTDPVTIINVIAELQISNSPLD